MHIFSAIPSQALTASLAHRTAKRVRTPLTLSVALTAPLRSPQTLSRAPHPLPAASQTPPIP